MTNFPGGPYRPPRHAHDIHTTCPWCGAYSSRSCELEEEMGSCPWEDSEPDPDLLRENAHERERLAKEYPDAE